MKRRREGRRGQGWLERRREGWRGGEGGSRKRAKERKLCGKKGMDNKMIQKRIIRRPRWLKSRGWRQSMKMLLRVLEKLSACAE